MKRDESLLTVYIICPRRGDMDERLTEAEHDIREFIAKNGYKGKNDYNIRISRPEFWQKKYNRWGLGDGALGTIVQIHQHFISNWDSIGNSNVIWLCNGWEEDDASLMERIWAKMYGKNILNHMCDSVFTYHKLNNVNSLSTRVYDNYSEFHHSTVVPPKMFKFMKVLDEQDGANLRLLWGV